MRTEGFQIAETPEDLLSLPVGSAILSNHRKVFELDQVETPTYPEPFPEKTGFPPLDSDNQKEWRKDKAKWEKANPPRSDAGRKYWIEPGTLQSYPQEGLDHWFPALILPEPKSHSN